MWTRVVRSTVDAARAQQPTTCPRVSVSLATSSATTDAWILTSVRTVPVNPPPSVSTPSEHISVSVLRALFLISLAGAAPLISVSLTMIVPALLHASMASVRTHATFLDHVELTPSVLQPTTSPCAPVPPEPVATPM